MNIAECERFFEPLAHTIGEFASSRNLKLDKYYHDSPTWALCFAHPISGFGRIELTPQAKLLRVSVVVWKDDYDSATRYLRRAELGQLERDNSKLSDTLSRGLNDTLQWHFDRQFTPYPGYEKEWHAVPKQVFEASEPDYPVPTAF